jgi:hypothetical protein
LNFAPAVTYGSGGYEALSVAVADVNGDGKPDLVVANCGSSIYCPKGTVGVLLGNGDGTFQAAVTYSSGGPETTSVAVADVNGDGKPDLVVANAVALPNGDGSVGVLLGNGDGTFQTAVAYDSGGNDAVSIAVADVNGDGKPDLVVVNECVSGTECNYGSVAVLLGNGDGTFQTAVIVYETSNKVFPMFAALADVNRDGKPDLLVANMAANSAGAWVSVLLGNGDGTFQTAVDYDSGGNDAVSIAVADVNGDGKPDIVVANANGVGVLLGNGDGTFQTAVTYGSLSGPVAVADLNGDGKPDIVVGTGNDVSVLLGNGDGTFQTAVTYGSGGNGASSAAVADLNGDGKPDIVVANCASTGNNCGQTNGVVGVLINTSLNPTATTLTSSPNPSNFGQAVTFTAAVTGQQYFYKTSPTGTVTFFDGTTNIGSSSLNGSEVATLTTSTLAVGTHSITATYNGDTHCAPSTSPVLSQVVQGAIVSLSPTSLNFGNQTVDITSAAKGVTLTNIGNIALTISSIGITGTDSGDFARTTSCSGPIAPNGTCTISVTFKPAATGTRSAAVSITDNAPKSPQKISLTGVGVLPAVTFSPTSLVFPTQVVYTASKTKTVKLTNSGLGVLKITKIAATGPFSQTNNCGSTVKPAGSCALTVAFKPTAIGALSGAVPVTDNAPGSPQKVTLKGTGTAVQLTPLSLSFGNQPVGTTSLAKTITLSNKSHAAVSITSISITGVDAGDFHETNTCSKSVASGASCLIHVTFKPTATGTRTAALSVSDNGGGSPQKANLTGTGT